MPATGTQHHGKTTAEVLATGAAVHQKILRQQAYNKLLHEHNSGQHSNSTSIRLDSSSDSDDANEPDTTYAAATLHSKADTAARSAYLATVGVETTAPTALASAGPARAAGQDPPAPAPARAQTVGSLARARAGTMQASTLRGPPPRPPAHSGDQADGPTKLHPTLQVTPAEWAAKWNASGPESAAGLRSLRLLPLLSDLGVNASDLPPATEKDVDDAIERFKAFYGATQPVQLTDPVIDTLPAQVPLDKPSRKRATQAHKKHRDIARQLRAYLLAVTRQHAPLTWDLFVPHSGLWQVFANDCAQHAPVATLKAYATMLNKLSQQLADQLGPTHPTERALRANKGYPWHSEKLAEISTTYADARADEKLRAANDRSINGGEQQATEQPREEKATPVPTDMLDDWISDAQALINEHQLARQQVDAATAALGKRAGLRKRKDSRRPSDLEQLQQQLLDAKNTLSSVEYACAGFTASFLQLFMMARASSITAGLEHGGPGLAADVQFDDVGMSYTIRFMKGWTLTSSFYGERLPLRYDGPNRIPWGAPSSPFPSTRRHAMLQVIQYTVTHVDMSRYDCLHPESQGSDRINSFLRSRNATGSLSAQDSVKGGLAQHISTHSIRKAGVAIALAAGVSQANIRRWTRWQDPQMVWQYAPNDFTVPPEWHDVFGWMKSLPAQNAQL